MEQRGGVATNRAGSWTIRWDGTQDDERVSDEIARQLEDLDADGEHVVVTKTDSGIERVSKQ